MLLNSRRIFVEFLSNIFKNGKNSTKTRQKFDKKSPKIPQKSIRKKHDSTCLTNDKNDYMILKWYNWMQNKTCFERMAHSGKKNAVQHDGQRNENAENSRIMSSMATFVGKLDHEIWCLQWNSLLLTYFLAQCTRLELYCWIFHNIQWFHSLKPYPLMRHAWVIAVSIRSNSCDCDSSWYVHNFVAFWFH